MAIPRQWVTTARPNTRPTNRRSQMSLLIKVRFNIPCLYLMITRGIKKTENTGKYTALKNKGLEWLIASLPKGAVILKIKATIIIYTEPFSLNIEVKGPNIPIWKVSILSR